ncbi:MAG: EamA family transporter [Pelistega sp.]|nr:EamA family transporter [Pelistega sp.]
MPLFDWFLALITIFAWGINFLASKIALSEVPPLMFGAIRFILVVFPAIFFVKFPKAPLGTIIAYSLTINFLQFACMLSSIAFGLASGLTSLIMQLQAFFTVLLAALYFKEKIPVGLLVAFFIALIGMVLIVEGGNMDTALPMAGLIAAIGAAFFWACGNITIKKMPQVNMLSLVIWGGLFSIPFFMLASYLIEGPELIQASWAQMTIKSWGGIGYAAYASTLVGYVIWGKLLARRPISLIAPLTLLVPIIGFISGYLAFDEKMTWVQWLGSATVLIALCINVFWLKIIKFLHLSSFSNK